MYSCEFCDFITAYKKNLDRHVITQHAEQTVLFACECGYKTNKKSHYDRHLQGRRHVPQDRKEYVCQYCAKSFGVRQNKWNHEQRCKSRQLVTGESLSERTVNINQGTIINNHNHITNHITIIAAAHANSNPSIIPMVFPYDLNMEEPAGFRVDHILREKRRYTNTEEALKHLLEDPYNMPMRKNDLKSAFSEIHIGNNQWVTHRDSDVAPRLLFHSMETIRGIPYIKRAYPVLCGKLDDLQNVVSMNFELPEYLDPDDIRLMRELRGTYNSHLKTIALMANWGTNAMTTVVPPAASAQASTSEV